MQGFRDNSEEQRFELAHAGGVSFCDYRVTPEGVLLTHVETPPALRGRGHAAKLMDAIVTHARENKLKLQPLCSYAVAYLQRRRDVSDVLAG
ncbi:bsr4721 [alpha proteobacterium U9-1i]|nr:bsr4721 [alpha proteobacterium U9-1i]